MESLEATNLGGVDGVSKSPRAGVVDEESEKTLHDRELRTAFRSSSTAEDDEKQFRQDRRCRKLTARPSRASSRIP